MEKGCLELSMDASGILGCGVYVLRWQGRVIHVGRAEKSMLAWIHAHRANGREAFGPMARPLKFDGIDIFACARVDLDAMFARILELTAWFNPTLAPPVPIRRRA